MRLTVSQPWELRWKGCFLEPADGIACCAPFGTDGTCPVGYTAPSAFTLSRARTTAGFLAAVGLFTATVLCCADTLAALVSRSRAEVLQSGKETRKL